MQIQQTTKYLSGKDLRERWDVSMRTIERLRSESSLPYVKIDKQPRYPLNLVEIYEIRNNFLSNVKNIWGLEWQAQL